MSLKVKVRTTHDEPLVVDNYYSRYWRFTSHYQDAVAVNAPFQKHFYVYAKAGAGVHGEVFAAYDKILNKHVAIKVYNDQRLLLRELAAMKNLQHLQYFCKCYYTQEEEKETVKYIIMDLKGPSLTHLIHAYGPLSLYTAVTVGTQLIEAVKMMHKEGILHNNIKSNNVVIGMPPHSSKVFLLGFSLTGRFNPENPKPPDVTEKKCRREDLYRILYILIQMRTTAEYVNEKGYCFAEQNPKTIRKLLLESYNEEFLDFKTHLDELSFHAEPDYSKLKFYLNRLLDGEDQHGGNMEWESDPSSVWIIERASVTPTKECCNAHTSQCFDPRDESSLESQIVRSIASKTNQFTRQRREKKRYKTYEEMICDERQKKHPDYFFLSHHLKPYSSSTGRYLAICRALKDKP